MEKLEGVYRELEEEKGNLDRLRREATSRADQDRNNMNQLRDEFNRLKSRLEETKLKADEERIKLEVKMEEVLKERESAQRETEELQVQLHMAEDKVDGLHSQLHENNRKLKECKQLYSHFIF